MMPPEQTVRASQSWHRFVAALVATLGAVGLLSLLLLPFRGHLSVATAGLVLVVPVVLGVVLGGLAVEVLAVAAGFIAYDVLFIPPYGTLAVGAAQNWAALGVYVLVLVPVAVVVSAQRKASRLARQREHETRQLYELSQALAVDAPDLLSRALGLLTTVFHPHWAAVLRADPPDESLGHQDLVVVARIGEPPDDDAIVDLTRRAPLGLAEGSNQAPLAVPLLGSAHPLGLLVVDPAPPDRQVRRFLQAFGAQVAMALERDELRRQAVRAEALAAAEEAKRVLLRTVSHDLRTPLATVKAALSELAENLDRLPAPARAELVELAEGQAAHLERMVADLLDLSRLEAGGLEVRAAPVAVHELLDDALVGLAHGIRLASSRLPCVRRLVPPDLPPVFVDRTLVGRALANLVENAARLSPQQVIVGAIREGPDVQLFVHDRGPWVPWALRESLLRLGTVPPGSGASTNGSGRAGLGLAIASAFVAAHGRRLHADDNPDGGARFWFTVPSAPREVT
jgi:two-component system sensor histidine kinase KdpD